MNPIEKALEEMLRCGNKDLPNGFVGKAIADAKSALADLHSGEIIPVYSDRLAILLCGLLDGQSLWRITGPQGVTAYLQRKDT